MSPFGFHPEARSEFKESARYYEDQQDGLGYRFLDAVRGAVVRIQTHPKLYHEFEPGFRQCHVLRFPYGIIYECDDSKIKIIALMHLHREPGYWKTRI